MSAARPDLRDALCDVLRRFVRGEESAFRFPDRALLDFASLHQVTYPLFAILGDEHPMAEPARREIAARAEDSAAQARSLQEELSPVADLVWLKGGAGLAESDFSARPDRFMADLDILVSREAAGAVRERLAVMGYRAASTPYHERLHPHLPIMTAPDRPLGVEIHTRLLRFSEGGLLHPGEVRQRARSVMTSAGAALVPDTADRIVHVIAHAQIASHRFARRTFLARDALELHRLASSDRQALQEAMQRCGAAGHAEAAQAMLLLAERVLAEPLTISLKPTDGARDWAELVWSAGLPVMPARSSVMRGWLKTSLDMIAEGEKRAALGAFLFSSAGRHYTASRLRHYFSGRQD